MKIQLFEGEFNSQDAIDLITKMIKIKIQYHEEKIESNSNEEDMKRREAKIKRFQNDLDEIRSAIKEHGNQIKLESIIQIK